MTARKKRTAKPKAKRIRRCGAWSESLAARCDQPRGHRGRHSSDGDEFASKSSPPRASEPKPAPVTDLTRAQLRQTQEQLREAQGKVRVLEEAHRILELALTGRDAEIFDLREQVRRFVAQPQPPTQSNAEIEAFARMIEQENLARRRVAAFMEKTTNVPWMRHRFGSFEVALNGGLRNLIDEANKDVAEGKMAESREATFFFLFGLMSTLRTAFYREAMKTRSDAAALARGGSATDEDTADAVFEARIWNNAAQREDVLTRFRVRLGLATDADKAYHDRLMKQAQIFDTLNPGKEHPKA